MVYAVSFADDPPASDAAGLADDSRRGSPVGTAAVRALLARGIDLLDDTIRRNRRPDGLYHSYNVLTLPPGDVLDLDGTPPIRRLEPMLEGQVAVLSSGLLSDDEALEVLAALRGSPLYREDQRSYLLQPDREPAPFLDRNRLSTDWRRRVPALADRVDTGEPVPIVLDRDGVARFAADLANVRDLRDAVIRLPGIPAAERAEVEVLWEEVFHHQEFTGPQRQLLRVRRPRQRLLAHGRQAAGGGAGVP